MRSDGRKGRGKRRRCGFLREMREWGRELGTEKRRKIFGDRTEGGREMRINCSSTMICFFGLRVVL